MTEIMPVPRNLNFTVLPAESLIRAFLLLVIRLVETNLSSCLQINGFGKTSRNLIDSACAILFDIPYGSRETKSTVYPCFLFLVICLIETNPSSCRRIKELDITKISGVLIKLIWDFISTPLFVRFSGHFKIFAVFSIIVL